MLTRRPTIVHALVALAHVAAFLALAPHGLSAFPLDDAYTHQVYAEGIRYGDGLSYLPGVPAAGSTSPLWALVLAPLQLAPLGLLVGLTKGLGVLGWIALAAVVRALVERLTERADVAAFAGLAIVLDPALAIAALSGMEVILAALLLALGAWAIAAGRERVAGVVLGLGILARPELTLAWGIANVLVGLRDRRPSPWLLAPGLVAWGAWGAWNLHAAGTWLPTTFFAKHGPQSVVARWRDVPRAIAQTFGAWPTLAALPFAWLGARRLRESLAGRFLLVLLIAWPLGIAWAHDLRETWKLYWWRYALPAHPLFVVAAAMGAWAVGRAARAEARSTSRVARLARVAFVVALLAGGRSTARHHAESCRNVAELNVAAARWLDENAAPDAWIASNDAGAVRRLTGRPVIDLLGLNDAAVLADRGAVLRARRPRWYVVFPSWFPDLATSPRFEVVARFRSEPYDVCAQCDQSELVIVSPR